MNQKEKREGIKRIKKLSRENIQILYPNQIRFAQLKKCECPKREKH